MRVFAVLAAVLLLAGCAGGGPGGGLGGGGRNRPPLPPQAQPTNVVATELAFARAAREEGQWAAYSEFAAPDAQVQWDGGLASAQSWLTGRAEPPAADRWVPRQAWASCDGSAVLVVGTSTDPAGQWSRFTRVWERQSDGTFRWVHTLSLPDRELTRARQADARTRAEDEARGDAILVEAGNFIRAKVADCAGSPPAADTVSSAQAGTGTGLSRDRTLRWLWEAPANGGAGRFAAYSWNGTEWDEVHSEPGGSVGE